MGGGAHGPAHVPGRSQQRLRRRVTGPGRLLDRGHQDLGSEVVATFGNGDRNLAGRSAVELGGASRARPGPAGEPLELHRQQALVGKPVQVECGSGSREPQRLGGLVSADRCVAVRDVLEQVPPDRLVQRADGRHPIRQRPMLHGHIVKQKSLDERTRAESNAGEGNFREEAIMATIPGPDHVAARRDLAGAPARQAFLLLRSVFTVAPIIFGLDKFANVLTDWPDYLAPVINDIVPGTAQQAMYAVGVVEILAGVAVALKPRYGGLLVAAWLAGIIVNL